MIRILLADDHSLVRHGFRMILAAQPDMEIAGKRAMDVKPSSSPKS